MKLVLTTKLTNVLVGKYGMSKEDADVACNEAADGL